MQSQGCANAASSAAVLIDPERVAVDYGIPTTTQAVWRCTNRYGFRDLAIKVGTRIRYKRADIESWLESRRSSTLVEASA